MGALAAFITEVRLRETTGALTTASRPEWDGKTDAF
jgi:hypothetical protein